MIFRTTFIWLTKIQNQTVTYTVDGLFEPSDQILLIFSILVAFPFLAAIPASIFLLPLAEKFGRKSLFLVMILIHILHNLLFVIAKPLNSYIPLIFSRLILGLGWGISANVIIYLGEISTIKNRGMVQSSYNVWFLGGSIVQNLLGLEVVMGTEKLWNYVPLCALVFLVPIIFTFRHIPESLSFLNKKSTFEEVRRVSQTLYGVDPEDLDLDLAHDEDGEMQSKRNSVMARKRRSVLEEGQSVQDSKPPPKRSSLKGRLSKISGIQDYDKFEEDKNTKNIGLKEVWNNKPLLKATIYTLILTLFDEWAGLTQIAMFATAIIRTFNFSILLSQMFQLGFNLIRLLGAFLGAYLAKKITRKINLLISSLGCLSCHAALFVLGFYEFDENDVNHGESNAKKNLSIKISELLLIYLMAIFFNCGVHSLISTVPDLVPVDYKVWIGKVTKITSHITILISGLIFPFLVKKLENYVYLCFCCVNVLFTIWILLRHVESKDFKSIEVFKKFEDRLYWF